MMASRWRWSLSTPLVASLAVLGALAVHAAEGETPAVTQPERFVLPGGQGADPDGLAAPEPSHDEAAMSDLDPDPTLFEQHPDSASRPHLWLGGRGGAWFMGIEGTEVRAARAGLRGTPIDLQADLAFDDRFTVPCVEAHLRTRWISLYADFFSFDESARTTLDTDVVFGGVTFSASTPVRGRLETLSAGGRIELLPFAFDTWELALILGGRYFRFTAEIESLASSFDIGRRETVEGGLPFAGAAVRLYPTTWSEIYAQGQGLYYAQGGDRISYAELEAGAALRLLGDHVAIVGAYRALLGEIEVEDDRLQTRWHGPVIMLRLQL